MAWQLPARAQRLPCSAEDKPEESRQRQRRDDRQRPQGDLVAAKGAGQRRIVRVLIRKACPAMLEFAAERNDADDKGNEEDARHPENNRQAYQYACDKLQCSVFFAC